jgi:hypothetical protein
VRSDRLSVLERALLGALAAWALVPLALMIVHAIRADLQLTGADGPIGADQLQYMAWVRDGGAHGLASNLFELSPTAHAFLQPMFTLSGLLWRIGVPIAVSYLIWTPVAIAALFGGAVAWTSRLLPAQGFSRAAALALALFFVTPAAPLVLWFTLGSGSLRVALQQLSGEVTSAGALWGYLPTAIAVGLMPVTLLALERAGRARSRRDAGASVAVASLAAALVSWLHPWQGVVLVVVIPVVAAWDRLRRWRLFAPAAVSCALPLTYYVLLSRYDSAWRLGARAELAPHLPASAILLGLLPPVLFACAGVRRPGETLAERALLAWPVVSIGAYFALRSFPAHALEGLSLPLSVLMVRAWGRLSPRPGARGRFNATPVAAAAVVALVTLPGLAYYARGFWDVASGPTQQYYLTGSEARALHWISSQAPPGGVLASVLFADAIPSQTGRPVWVGHQFWSQDYLSRARSADALLGGALSKDAARAVVLASGARLIAADCRHRTSLSPALRGLLASTRRFGCATVYVVRSGPRGAVAP